MMTADGVVVFHGAIGGAPYGVEAFTPVDSAALGATRRAELSALEPAPGPEGAEGVTAGIGEGRRAASAAADEIRFLSPPSGGDD